MQYIAESKNVKVSPRKARLVVEGIKKMPIGTALLQLQMLHKRAASPVRKTLASAVANATHNFSVAAEDLVIQEILVNEGISYKRYHFASRGRIKPYKKRTSHIRVVLSAKTVVAPVQAALPAATDKKATIEPKTKKISSKKKGGAR